jgi:alpha-beta hydrolase superfamily lysophospholipase
MLHDENYFTARDGLRLYEQWWLPEQDPRAVVVVVHGINEHGGRYRRLADDLTRRGYAVCAMDLRGHGNSDGPRAWIAAFDEYLDDLELLLDRARARQPGKPLFLLGHSLGGAIVALLGIMRTPSVDGLIFSAPAVLIAGDLFPMLRHVASLASRVWPTLRLARMGCRFMSRDPVVVEAFRNDPLVFQGRFPVRTGAEILKAASRIQVGMKRLTSPLLILHGTGDMVTDPKGSRQLYTRAGSTDKTLYLYPGLYHEVLNEPERETVLSDLLAWLDRHC